MFSLVTTITFLLTLSPNITPTSAAHAGFHVQFPWTSRGPNPKTRPGLDEFNPFCSTFSPHSIPARQQPNLTPIRGHHTQPATLPPPLTHLSILLRSPRRPCDSPLYPKQSTQEERRLPPHHPAGCAHPTFGAAVRECHAAISYRGQRDGSHVLRGEGSEYGGCAIPCQFAHRQLAEYGITADSCLCKR